MSTLIALLLIIYLAGVAVVLTPLVQADWNNVPASEFAADVARHMPRALAWPEAAYRSMTAPTS
jgi:hypothetical protein